ncbi:hypothetical protein [Treponema pedis]|uniref:hypothetical protein n=1 Tax=Treponema pedis TaxID=409322 RepID=UPI0021F30C26|nr:hypothetical protein [Treponema pedis]
MVSVSSFKPVAVSVTAVMRALCSFAPSTLTPIASRAVRKSAVGMRSTVRRCTAWS